jgi:hypothetical protein
MKIHCDCCEYKNEKGIVTENCSSCEDYCNFRAKPQHICLVVGKDNCGACNPPIAKHGGQRDGD